MKAKKNINLNKNGYPANWDKIQLEPNTQAFKEATKHAINDSDSAFEKLQVQDPIIQKLVNMFDGEVPNENVSLKP